MCTKAGQAEHLGLPNPLASLACLGAFLSPPGPPKGCLSLVHEVLGDLSQTWVVKGSMVLTALLCSPGPQTQACRADPFEVRRWHRGGWLGGIGQAGQLLPSEGEGS